MTHHLVNPETLSPPTGFSHVVVPAAGRTIYLAGQAAQLPDGSIGGAGLVEQFALAAANVATALRAAGAEPHHLVSLLIFVTDLEDYRVRLAEIGPAYRAVFGRHYPAISLFEVSRLFDPAALVELVATAVVPAPAASD